MFERIDGRFRAVGHSADRKPTLDLITLGRATIPPDILTDFFPGCQPLGGKMISHGFYEMVHFTVLADRFDRLRHTSDYAFYN
jgi:hypothetical protein